MATARRFRGLRIAIGIGLPIILVAYFLWFALFPKINGASYAEIVAALPAEIRTEPPADLLAQARFDEVLKLARSVDPDRSEKLGEWVFHKDGKHSKRPDLERFAAATEYVRRCAPIFKKIRAILGAGPLQFRRDPKNALTDTKPWLTDLVRAFQSTYQCTEVLSRHGQGRLTIDQILTLLSLDRRMGEANNDQMSMMTEDILDGLVVGAIGIEAKDQKVSVDDLRSILRALLPMPAYGEWAASALRADFHLVFCRELASNPIETFRSKVSASRQFHQFFRWAGDVPVGDEAIAGLDADVSPLAGTYDAVETVQVCAHYLLGTMANAQRSWADRDRSYDTWVKRQLVGLPRIGVKGRSALGYRIQMNTRHNTIGRAILACQTIQPILAKIQFNIAALRGATTVLVASRIYRFTHGGALPSTREAFRSILRQWPADPFSGKPMIYRPKEQRVYSVGVDLNDDGGDITSTRDHNATDVGVSLRS
ncbi:MAG: hypothetical protein P4L46_02520 [Fimbriimonas sp.]|nr:hypothetical protein [Fimbriimonas sp.]